MEPRRLSDTTLLSRMRRATASRDMPDAADCADEIARRLARNPRCPTCGAEQPVYPGVCSSCASVPDELDLRLKETLCDDTQTR